jgi:hypothetical protein
MRCDAEAVHLAVRIGDAGDRVGAGDHAAQRVRAVGEPKIMVDAGDPARSRCRMKSAITRACSTAVWAPSHVIETSE